LKQNPKKEFSEFVTQVQWFDAQGGVQYRGELENISVFSDRLFQGPTGKSLAVS